MKLKTTIEIDVDGELSSLIERVETWDREDVRELFNILDQIPEVLRASGRPPRTSDVIDYSDLPTEPIPVGMETYPIWAMDTSGRCLVGDTAEEIEGIEEIRAYYQ